MNAHSARRRRQLRIAELIRSEPLASQERLVERLAGAGLAVTQATVSRDLEELGAVKVRRGGVLAYALPDQAPEHMGGGDWAAERLRRVLAEQARSIEAAGTLVVIRTPPGSAHLVAVALDGVGEAAAAGTVAGDDTVFVAIRDGFAPGAAAARLRRLAGIVA